jgi:hypothetical protein
LALSPTTSSLFGASYYKDLADVYSDKFDDFEIEYDVIEDGSDEDVKEFFQRLQEGLQLSSSEKLNSIHSNIRNFAYEIANHSFFKNKINVTNKRYGHFDIACKVAVIEIDGLDAGTRFDDIKSIFESYASYPIDSKNLIRIRNALDYLDNVFDIKIDKLQSRSIVQSFITFTTKLNLEKATEQLYQEKIKRYFIHFLKELEVQIEKGHKATDYDFIDFQRTISANTKNGVRVRHEILLRKMVIFDPGLYELLDNSQVLESGIRNQPTKIVESIQSLIKSLNDRYSSKKGEDLFKMTNKTVPALQGISIAIDNEDKLKDFIDNLYFLFRESIGQRFGESLPISFVDVNLIRTGFDHDVDHGDAGTIAKKKIKIGKAIEKYSAKTNLTDFDTATYIIFQISLLTSIKEDLISINIDLL